MSGSVDDVPCMNFEANIFANSLCQHCFRDAEAHQMLRCLQALTEAEAGATAFSATIFLPLGSVASP
uniref:Uncharacterized protein n=1 Tax=Malurus cyaneus samueli TaxID=2593467 RepID=A0A8C5T8P9_9PASS